MGTAGDEPEPPPRLPVTRPRRGCWARAAALSVCASASVFVVAGCGSAAPPPSAPSTALGRQVALHLPSERGALVTLPAGGMRATVIDAFSPACKPCAEKVPALLRRNGELVDAGAQLVLVAVLSDGESSEAARAALTSWGVPPATPFLLDRGDVLRRELAVNGLPATVVLDASGRVRWVAPPDASAGAVVAAGASAANGQQD